MQNSHFSVNVDECTASNTMKVLSILASYFDDEIGRCVVEHCKCLECVHVNAEVLFSKICNVFSEDEILLENFSFQFSVIQQDTCVVKRVASRRGRTFLT